MKRQDVQVGVEYAATGALAYGREPDRNSPRRVRFTDNRPGPWLRIVTSRYDEGAGALGGNAWVTASMRIVHENSVDGRQALEQYPHSFTRARIDSPAIGAECVYVDTIKGGLPGEVWRHGAWTPALVIPAEIHRTWAEVEVEQAERQAALADLDAKSRVDDINALLATIGLSGTIKAQRIGSGLRIDLASVTGGGFTGDRLLDDLTAWAQTHGLIATVVT